MSCSTSAVSNTLTMPNYAVPELILGWDDISNANLLVGDASNVADWNTFFDLPTNGTPFASVQITGNDVNLIGGSDIHLRDNIFLGNNNLISFQDNVSIIITAGDGCFAGCYSATSFYLPALETAGISCFESCSLATSFDLPLLETAGIACFFACLSASFDLPALQTAGDSCFVGCYVFYLPALQTAGNSCFEFSNVSSFDLPLLETAGNNCFAQCYNVESFNFPLLKIAGDSCFEICEFTFSFDLPSLEVAGDGCFDYCQQAESFNLPSLEVAGDGCFANCFAVDSLSLPSCTNLGQSVGNNNVFRSMSGRTITLTVPSALMTCNGGNPDGDIQYLQNNNTVTIITV